MRAESRTSSLLHRYLRIPYTLNVKVFRSPKNAKATVVFIHGIGNSLHAWDEVVALMPHDVRLIGIDLLGFGKSPKPRWATYSAKTQARSVGVTLLNLRLTQRPIIVGHSLGALVAVELARRYPLVFRRLVLCSPPFYKPENVGKGIPSPEDMLRRLYRTALKNPERLEKLSPYAVKLGLANKVLSITKDNAPSYIAALEASIINQTSLKDVAELKLPIDILYGAVDPVVVGKNISSLGEGRKSITTKRILAGHEVVGRYSKEVVETLVKRIAK